jgi:hypothetical protein
VFLRACGGGGGAEGLKVRFRISSQLMDLQFVSCASLKRAPSPIYSITLHTLRHVSSLRTGHTLSISLSGPGRSSTDGFREDRCFCLPSNGWRILVMLLARASCFAHASWWTCLQSWDCEVDWLVTIRPCCAAMQELCDNVVHLTNCRAQGSAGVSCCSTRDLLYSLIMREDILLRTTRVLCMLYAIDD